MCIRDRFSPVCGGNVLLFSKEVPKKGTREKLVELATQNAEIVLRQDKDLSLIHI